MGVVRVARVAALGIVLAGCGAGSASPPLSSPPATISPTGVAGPTASVQPSFAVATPKSTPSATASPEPTPAPIPAKPTGVKFKIIRQVETKDGYRETYRISWKAPRTEGIEIRVLGVTECLSEPATPKPGTWGPCLVPHTLLPTSALEPIAKGPASDGAITWTWDTSDGCDIYDYLWRSGPAPDGTLYFAVVIAAYGASGHSVFAIAYAGGWSVPDPDDMPC